MTKTGLIVLLTLALGLAGCSRENSSESAHTQQDSPPSREVTLPPNSQGVTTAVVQARPLPEYLEIPAHIAPDPTRVVRVYSPVGGRLIAVKVIPGEWVKAGEALATLESSDVATALASYAKSNTDLQLKQQALRRASDLYHRGAVPLKDFQQAQADFAIAQADLESVRRQLTLLGISPDERSDIIRVAAPRSGVVLQISASAGEYSKSLDSSEPLCVLADLSNIWALGDLLEKDLSHVKVGDPAELTLVAFPEEKWRGRVSMIGNTVDPTTRTVRLRVVLPNPRAQLRPDMFGTLKLLHSTHLGFAVPSTAVVRESNLDYVYVQQSPGRFAPEAVTLGGPVGDNDVEVLSGLKASDIIVTQGAVLLRRPTP